MRKFISGVLVGSVLTVGITTYATIGKNISIIENVKKVVVNQREQFIDSKIPPFTYNGTVYVPLKMISKALNMDINWDGSIGTVYLGGKQEETVGYWGKDFVDMSSTNSSYSNNITYAYNDQSNSIKDSTNRSYSNYLVFSGYGGVMTAEKYVTFPLDGKYKTFKCKVGFTKDGNDYPVPGYLTTKVKIFADDRLIYNDILNKDDYPKEIQLDISQAKTIKFSVDSETPVYVPRKMGFFEGEFFK